MLVVIDWPICAGFRRGEEYKSFFKEAKHLNDYHVEVTDITFQIEGYHPMRYQTKKYDERVSGLSVFCQQTVSLTVFRELSLVTSVTGIL